VSGTQGYATSITVGNGATLKASNAAVSTAGGTNNGTIQIDNSTANLGNFTNNGLLKSDPSTVTFTTLTVAVTGAIQASAGDVYQISGDFLNHSTQATTWDTSAASLDFVHSTATNHNLLLTGADLGATAAGLLNNFAWGELGLATGDTLTLLNGLGAGTVALYVGLLDGFSIANGIVQNVIGNGFDIYYDASLNGALNGLTYALGNGGSLIAYVNQATVPVPGSLALLAVGLAMFGFRRRGTRQ
jgi:hypothetical protein